MHWQKEGWIESAGKVSQRCISQNACYNKQKICEERFEDDMMDGLMVETFCKSCDYNIVLIGFMGAGKSTVARFLGAQFGMEIVEMDEQIEKSEKKSIPQIFRAIWRRVFSKSRNESVDRTAEFPPRRLFPTAEAQLS